MAAVMNDWDALLDRVRALELPPNDFVIVGSGPLWAHGLMDAPGDVDILARGAAWDKAAALAPPFVAPRGDCCVSLCDGRIEIFDGWTPAVWPIESVFAAAVLHDGLPFAPLAFTLAVKRALNRPKDWPHIRLLTRRLNLEGR